MSNIDLYYHYISLMSVPTSRFYYDGHFQTMANFIWVLIKLNLVGSP